MTFRVGVLGPVQLAGRDAGGVAMRALLVALTLTGSGSVRSVAALADDIWGEEQPQNPKAALQTLVSRARAAGGADLVRSAPGGYALGTDATDLQRAREVVSAAADRAVGASQRIDLLESAVALWHGEPGLDLGDAPVAGELARTAAALIDTIRSGLATAYADAGRDSEAIALLTVLADERPFDDRVHVALMESLARAGRTPEALSLFAALRTRLRDELGTSPSPAAVELNARLLQSSDQPGPRMRIGVQAAPNELIGRDDALREAKALLARTRLLTILGAGGLGKTRLAQAIALDADAPAVVVVPLAGVREDAGVPIAVAAALGISEITPGRRLNDAVPRPDLMARVIAMLGERRTLLVLDNCEQVVDGAAQCAAELLAAVPTLRIVTTSRTPLAITAERVLPLEPLTIAADPEAPAVRLFIERARAARPGATLDLETVARLCRHLDGLPLAIELAAARVRTMTPEQIERRLENRFALLTTGDRTAPERHRTLQAVIEWSWDLLAPEAQRALSLLSVLPGGFSASIAEAVLGEPADDVLDMLVSHSLLGVIESPEGAEVRFRMLETVREFGQRRLQEAGSEGVAWEAVISWATSFAVAQGEGSRRFPAGLTAAEHLSVSREHDNLVHVLRHLLAEDRDADAVVLFTVLGQSWFIRGSFTEFIGYAPRMVGAAAGARDSIGSDLVVIALAMGVLGCMISGDPSAGRGLALLRLRRDAAGDRLAPAWRLLAEALEVAARGGTAGAADITAGETDPRAQLAADILLSQAAENDGEPEAAMRAARSAWERARRIGERWAEGMAADLAAQLAAQSGDAEDALVWLDRAAEVFREYDAQDQLSQQEWVRGGALLCLRRTAEARPLFQRLVDEGGLSQDGLELTSIGVYGLAEAALLDGDLGKASEYFAAAMRAFAEPTTRRSPWYLMAMSGYLAAAVRSLGLPADEVAVWERRLRTRTIAACRQRREGVDRPVLGTALMGWSAWALRSPGQVARGVEAVALAEVLGGRQNMPTLDLTEHLADAERIAGADIVSRVRAEAGALAPEQRVERGLAVLSGR
ncbi:ATP-binding protein [Microbacterium sp. NPDC057659]|uniref:ATP-binding protein n=1 Tax=Microbacterium sp. NPDC057659 TaxID=3346198 RepID=UPI00366F7B93